ncbi:MAG TPA: DUF4185 domain-containing protein [Catenuloplanes sp.]
MRRVLASGLTAAALAMTLVVGGVAQAAPAAPVTAAGFFDLFQARNDRVWSGGDQVTSLLASNGLTYWSFGDTAIGEEDPATGRYRDGWQMIANTLLVQRGGELAAAVAGQAVADPAAGERYWTQGMFEANGHLYVLCQRVRNTSDGYFEFRGVELAKFGFNPDGSLTRRGVLRTPSSGKNLGDSAATAQYAADAVVTGGFVYLFGYRNVSQQEDKYAPHRSYVARVPVASVESPASWRFQRDNGTWGAQMHLATPILNAQVSSVRLIGGRWVLAYKHWNGLGDRVDIETRASPFGAGIAPIVSFESAAGVAEGSNVAYQTYAPQLHPEQRLASGKLLVSVAWNAQDFWQLSRDADLYKPRFVEVALP